MGEENNKLELKVHEPDNMHGWGVEFDSTEKGEEITQSYVWATFAVCNNLKLNGINVIAFHQSAQGDRKDTPGYHYFEFLGAQTSRKDVEQIFPLIHEKAKNYLEGEI